MKFYGKDGKEYNSILKAFFGSLKKNDVLDIDDFETMDPKDDEDIDKEIEEDIENENYKWNIELDFHNDTLKITDTNGKEIAEGIANYTMKDNIYKDKEKVDATVIETTIRNAFKDITSESMEASNYRCSCGQSTITRTMLLSNIDQRCPICSSRYTIPVYGEGVNETNNN